MERGGWVEDGFSFRFGGLRYLSDSSERWVGAWIVRTNSFSFFGNGLG